MIPIAQLKPAEAGQPAALGCREETEPVRVGGVAEDEAPAGVEVLALARRGGGYGSGGAGCGRRVGPAPDRGDGSGERGREDEGRMGCIPVILSASE
jgi:hypothetical protein